MSYCRWGKHSDLYIIGTSGCDEADLAGKYYWECFACCFVNPTGKKVELAGREFDAVDSSYMHTHIDLLQHVLDHLKLGDRVKKYTLDRIINELHEELRAKWKEEDEDEDHVRVPLRLGGPMLRWRQLSRADVKR